MDPTSETTVKGLGSLFVDNSSTPYDLNTPVVTCNFVSETVIH